MSVTSPILTCGADEDGEEPPAFPPELPLEPPLPQPAATARIASTATPTSHTGLNKRFTGPPPSWVAFGRSRWYPQRGRFARTCTTCPSRRSRRPPVAIHVPCILPDRRRWRRLRNEEPPVAKSGVR